MAEINPNEVKAPVYRYFTVDLMSNKILMEIPFQKVSYERALKAGGEFSGQIPVIEKTRNLDLYENTMPGQTALYVIRDGECVWGGIIWSRSYGVKDQVLEVSASEFTSYFHHRLIWKTFNYQYGASVDVAAAPYSYNETYAYNMAANPKSAGGNTANWNLYGGTGTGSTLTGVTVYDSTVPGYATGSGATYAQVTFGTSATNQGGLQYFNGVTAGQQYNFSAYYKLTGATNTVRYILQFLNSSGQQVGANIYSADVALTTAWKQIVLTGITAPVGAVNLSITLYATAGNAWASGATLAGTAMRFAPTTDVTDYAYFDGSTASANYIVYSWNGTPGQSTSLRTNQLVGSTGTGGGTTTVTIEDGAARDVIVGAKVELEFYEPENFPYNGYYKVVQRDSPTASTFEIDSAVIANITSIGNPGFTESPTNYSRVYVNTDAPHGFSSGDTVTVYNPVIADFNGVFPITADNGPTSTQFYYTLPSRQIIQGQTSNAYAKHAMTNVTGATAARYLPSGASFDNVTLSVHTDTYDYIRGLINSVWEDFADIDFADDYLAPGTETQYQVIQTQLGGGYATITTNVSHNLVVGQSVTISEVGDPYNGTWTVAGIPSPTSFAYELSGSLPVTNVSILTNPITTRYIADGVAYITYPVVLSTTSQLADFYQVGDTINIPQMDDFDGLADIFAGTHVVEYHPAPGIIGWSTTSTASSSPASPVLPSLTQNITVTSSSGSSVNGTFSLGTPTGYSVNNGILSVSMAKLTQDPTLTTTPQVGAPINATLPYAMPVTQKSIDAPNSIKSIETDTPHGLDVGDTVIVNGDADVYAFSQIQYRADNTFTVTTTSPHNIKKNQQVVLSNTIDTYTDVRLLSVVGNYANVLINGGNHNITYPFWYTGSYRSGTTPYSDNSLINFTNFYSYFPLKTVAIKNNIATVESYSANTFIVNDTITIAGISETASVVSKEIQNGIVILTTSAPHNLQISDQITVTGVGAPYDTSSDITTVVLSTTETRVLYQLQDSDGNTITTSAAPTTASGTVSAANSTLNGNFVVTSKPSSTQLTFNITANDAATRTFASNSGVSVGGESILKYGAINNLIRNASGTPIANGYLKVGSTAQRIVSVPLSVYVPDINSEINLTSSADTSIEAPTLTSLSPVSDNAFNFQYNTYNSPKGWYVLSTTQNTFTCQWFAHTAAHYPGDTIYPSLPNVLGNVPITQFAAITQPSASGTAAAPSSVSGTFMVSQVVSDYRVNAKYFPPTGYYQTTPLQNVLETATNNSAYFRLGDGTAYTGNQFGTYAAGFSMGSGQISSVDYVNNVINITMTLPKSYGATTSTNVTAPSPYDARSGNRFHIPVEYQTLITQNVFTRTPIASAATYGPFPGNADLGMTFSTSQYSGVDVTPTAYRGYALTNVGDALDAYSGTTNGFEYRVDCAYDPEADKFSRTFVLIPINFPDPPNAGEVSDPSRFGADKLVFEYPGSVIDVKLDESAENSATRFFAVGNADLGEDAADPYSAASNLELLDENSPRKWPLLDDKESIQDVSDKDILGAFATQYLNEATPPAAEFTISVDGSLQPPLNTYKPGNWCSIIVNDDFIKARLASHLEPRDTVLVRKIDSYKVTVPDGITFPETVELTLIAEWDVDKKTT